MLTFLKILLAVFLVIVVLLVLGFLWLKRKFGGAIKSAMKYSRLYAPIQARETLNPLLEAAEPIEDEQYAARVETLWADLLAGGFAPLAEFTGNAVEHLRVAAHPSACVMAAVHVRAAQDLPPFVEFYLLTPAPVAHVQTSDTDAETLDLPHLKQSVDPALNSATALANWSGLEDRRPALDAQSFVRFYERMFAMRQDVRLARKPELSELRRRAAGLADMPTLDESEWQQALQMQLSGWRQSLDEALKDNGRRQLDLSDRQWQRIEDHIVVLHRELTADEVIALHGGDELIDRLGAQLKLQHLTPMQIFDEINQRRAEAGRFALLTRVSSPIQAVLYAPERMIQTFATTADQAEVLS